MNSQSCDRRRWSDLGVDPSLAHNANSVGDAYLNLGCLENSFTCAPYLLPSRPNFGEDVAWGESNAVVYANSVSEQWDEMISHRIAAPRWMLAFFRVRLRYRRRVRGFFFRMLLLFLRP
jgi:predicted aconitase